MKKQMDSVPKNKIKVEVLRVAILLPHIFLGSFT
jgi:hypothetical protein